jgi:signal peptidase I
MAEPAPPKPTGRRPASPPRLLATVAIVFLIVFLFIRVAFVEPFGVPTGSMAPTLIGNHRERPCPRCGYPVRVGIPAGGERAGFYTDIPCPNCGKHVNLSDARDINGDRVLVDKNVYQLRRPRRWEVAVFHCAADQFKPYVKRIVGLPSEEIEIIDGDAFADGELIRKTLREVREMRMPVFDLAFAPPGGWGPRWLLYPAEGDARLPRDGGREPAPADGSVLADGAMILDASAAPQQEVRLEYRHWNLDENREEPVRSANSYDGGGRRESNVYPVHDFYFRATVEVTAASPGSVFACRLFDGLDAMAVEVSVGKRSDGQVRMAHDKLGIVSAASKVALQPGSTYTIEFALVDRRASFAIDGRIVTAPSDLPVEKKRGEVRRPLQIGARGCRLVLRNVTLDRDVHYTQAGRHGTRTPAKLGDNEYFMLGDNSGNSQDSREWPEPGVPESDFIGKPFLIHQPLRLRGVSVGGRDRTYQTLDWSRLRWLH